MKFNRITMMFRTVTLKLRRRLISYVRQRGYWSYRSNENYSFYLSDGSRFDYPINSTIGRTLLAGGFEIAEVEFVRQSLKPGDVFFDIGANGGLFTIIAARKVGLTGHVYACEPGQRELTLLRHNIAINNLTNVTVIESAISNSVGKAELAISQDGAMNSLLKTEHPGQDIETWQTVETTTLDCLIEELNIKKIDFLKIDVEGAERLVIEGAKRTLFSPQQSPIILFEASNLNSVSFGYSVKELIAELEAAKFSIQYINKFGILKRALKDSPKIGTEIYNFVAFKQPISVKP